MVDPPWPQRAQRRHEELVLPPISFETSSRAMNGYENRMGLIIQFLIFSIHHLIGLISCLRQHTLTLLPFYVKVQLVSEVFFLFVLRSMNPPSQQGNRVPIDKEKSIFCIL